VGFVQTNQKSYLVVDIKKDKEGDCIGCGNCLEIWGSEL